MTSTEPRLRTRSLSDSTEHGRPQPAKPIVDAETAKRAAMPRAASTADMYSAANLAAEEELEEDPEMAWRNIAREQVDRDTIRDLAKFFRSTGPPSTSNAPAPIENCFGMSAPSESKRWSIRGLRKGRRTPTLRTRDSTELKTTAAGHSYMEISIPPAYGVTKRRTSLQSRLSMIQQSHIAPVLNPADKESLKRSSSVARGASPSSPGSSNAQTSTQDKHRSGRSSKAGDVAAVVSRSSSRIDRNPYKMSIRVSTAEPGVRSFLKMVDEWLEDQNSDDESQFPVKTQRPKSSRHKSRPSAVTLLTPVASEYSGDEEEDMSKPQITINSELPPRSSSLEAGLGSGKSLPMTPPPIDSTATSFPGLGSMPHTDDERPRTEPSSTSSPKSPDSQKQLSPFPANPAARLGSPGSLKQGKKPANISVKRTLEVPETNLQPDSPGFPKMLAAMTFPSPPESIHSHSANNSVSSFAMNKSLATPPLSGRSSAMSPAPSNLDQRLMQPGRPPLRSYKSDGATHTSYMSQPSIAASLGTSDGGSVDISVAQAARYRQGMPTITDHTTSHHNAKTPKPKSKSRRRASQESSSPDSESQRESTVSTVDSRQSVTNSERYRSSMKSDTSVTSDMTEVYGKRHPSNRESMDSINMKRSETPCSTKSISSVGTNGTTQSLAERRMARRARVREKVQRDLDASKANLKLPRAAPGPGSFADSVDSPVLGYFPNIGSPPLHLSRKAMAQGPSRLAQEASPPDTPTEDTDATSGRSQRSSSIHALIPETVEEAQTPVTPTYNWTFSPIMMEHTAPSPHHDSEPGTPRARSPPRLSITPIVTVANIEGRSPSASLRPLSLLVNGPSPPVPPRSSRRPETKSRKSQRPLPVRVANSPLELTIATDKTKRNSSPQTPTSPFLLDSASSPRMSLPPSRVKPTSAPATTGSYWNQPTQQHSRQNLSMEDKTKQWLNAHQQQTAEEWRLQAVQERMRRERLEKAKSTETSNGGLDLPTQEEEYEGDDSNEEEERCRRMREQHTRSTLRVLNGNGRTSRNSRLRTPSVNSDDDRTPVSEVSGGRETPYMDRDAEQRLLRHIMPLLENMNNTLKELKRDSSNQELSKKFVQSAMALAEPVNNGNAAAPSDRSSSSTAGMVSASEERVADAVDATSS